MYYVLTINLKCKKGLSNYAIINFKIICKIHMYLEIHKYTYAFDQHDS